MQVRQQQVLPRFASLELQAGRRKTVVMKTDRPVTDGDGNHATTRQIADHLRATGKMSEALGLYHHLLRGSDQSAETLDNYIRCAKAVNHDPAAGLGQILRVRPEADTVRAELIRLARRGGDHRRVRDLVDSAPGPAPVDWLLSAAASAMSMGDDDDAHRLYELAREAAPDNDAVAAGLARLNARKRDFAGVLAALDDGDEGQGATGLNSINLRVAAHRRLGRTGQAARAASEGIGELLESGNLHDTARLLDRMGFAEAASRIRDRILASDSSDGRSGRRRLAGHLISDGRISDGLREYRRLGGHNWKSRISLAHQDLLDVAARAMGCSPDDADWHLLEQLQVAMPGAVIDGLLTKAGEVEQNDWDRRRVLLVTGTLGAGGAEREVALTATGLAGRNPTPDWPRLATLQDMTIAGNAHLLDGLIAGGITHHDLGRQGSAPERLPLRLAYCNDLVSLLPDGVRAHLIRLCNLIMLTNPGVVHGWQDTTGAVAALAGLMCGVPRIVIGTRSVAPDRKEGRNRPWLRALMQGLLRHDRIQLINNSKSGAADYSRWLGLPASRIAHVANGFRMSGDCAPQRDDRTGEIVVGGVMRLTEEKRPDLWLETVLTLIRRGRHVRGLLVGDGPMLGDLARRIAEQDPEGRIELAGRRNDMDQQYARMDVLMLTSRTEGLPNVLVEAQAHEVPVISTDAGGASETFVDGTTGLLCRSSSAEELADRVAELADDPARRIAMGRDGVRHVREEFGLDRMLERTVRVYGWPEKDT